MLPFFGRAEFGAFIRDLLKPLAGARREFGLFEARGAPPSVPPPSPLPPSEEAAIESPPAPAAARRGGRRLIDLERRAKFGAFGS